MLILDQDRAEDERICLGALIEAETTQGYHFKAQLSDRDRLRQTPDNPRLRT
jgi:hypothetical protein